MSFNPAFLDSLDTLSVRAYQVLQKLGVESREQLLALDPRKVAAIPGCGRMAMKEICFFTGWESSGSRRYVMRPSPGVERKYLPTLAELIDRLSIVQLKAIFIPAHAPEYAAERALLEHDIDLILAGHAGKIGAREIHAIMVCMLANRVIWENEAKARAGGPEQDRMLKFTHSINGVRNTAKNRIAEIEGGRRDYKIDCFAADLTDFGAWDVFS